MRDTAKRILADIKGFGPILAVLVFYDMVMHFLGREFCLLYNLTGVPCAGCGLTRAALLLLCGKPAEAAAMNVMIFPLLLFALYCGFFRYIKGSEIKGLKIGILLLSAALLIHYGIKMYLYFPEREPYRYFPNNILARRLPGYARGAEYLVAWIAGR